MFCPQCGSKMESGERFCSQCGCQTEGRTGSGRAVSLRWKKAAGIIPLIVVLVFVGGFFLKQSGEILKNRKESRVYSREELSFKWLDKYYENLAVFDEQGFSVVGTLGEGGIYRQEIIDREGKVVFSNPKNLELRAWDGELISAGEEDGHGDLLWGFITPYGERKIAFEYDEVSFFSEGLAAVCKDGEWGYIDSEGRIIFPLVLETAGDFMEGLAAVELSDGTKGFMDKSGEIVLRSNDGYSFDWRIPPSFSEGLVPVVRQDKWGYADREGELKIPCIYEMAEPFSEGLAFVFYGDDQAAYIDTEGREVISLKRDFESVSADYPRAFHEGTASVYDSSGSGYCGLMDRTGKYVVPPRYEIVYGFAEGFAPAKKGEKWGYLDENGEEVIPFVFDSLTAFSDGRALVNIDGKSAVLMNPRR